MIVGGILAMIASFSTGGSSGAAKPPAALAAEPPAETGGLGPLGPDAAMIGVLIHLLQNHSLCGGWFCFWVRGLFHLP